MDLWDVLFGVGYALDTPGALTRGLLAGRPGTRASGRQMLESWGALGPNQPGLDAGDVAGFAGDVVVDPLAWAGGFLGAKALDAYRAYRGGKQGLTLADEAAMLPEGMLPAAAPVAQAADELPWAVVDNNGYILGRFNNPGEAHEFTITHPDLAAAQALDPNITVDDLFALEPDAPGAVGTQLHGYVPEGHFDDFLPDPPLPIEGDAPSNLALVDEPPPPPTRNPLMQGSEDGTSAPVFYSRLRAAAENLPDKPIPAAALMNRLQKAGPFTKEEAEWVGLDKYLQERLAAGEAVEKQKLLEYLDDNQIEVEEVLLEEEGKLTRYGVESDQAPYADYTMPGGEDYKVLLMKLANPARGPFRDPHFSGQRNTLAHVRFKTRTGPNNEKVLHIEEIQSDWHQQGAKYGYNQGDFKETLRERTNRAIDDLRTEMSPDRQRTLDEMLQRENILQLVETQDAGKILTRLGGIGRHLVGEYLSNNFANSLSDIARMHANWIPDAPIKHDWPALMMKRMIRYAAENDYDRVSWSTGEQVRKITGGELSGQQAFYDERLPGVAAKLGKPSGAPVQEMPMPDAVHRYTADKPEARRVATDILRQYRLDPEIARNFIQAEFGPLTPDTNNAFRDVLARNAVAEVQYRHPSPEVFEELSELVANAMNARENPPVGHSIPLVQALKEQAIQKGFPLLAVPPIAAGLGAIPGPGEV